MQHFLKFVKTDFLHTIEKNHFEISFQAQKQIGNIFFRKRNKRQKFKNKKIERKKKNRYTEKIKNKTFLINNFHNRSWKSQINNRIKD